MSIVQENVMLFLLVFTRMTAFFVVSPIFSQRGIPHPFKIGLAVLMSFLVISQLQGGAPLATGWAYYGLIIKEAMVGLMMGYSATVIFTAIQMAGAMIDLQVGFAMANLVDPQSGLPMPLMANFKLILATLFFLAMDGHHYLLIGLLNSYQLISVNSGVSFSDANLVQGVVMFITHSFAIALQIAAPMVGALFLVDLASGIIARTVPQMNFFVVGFPLKMILTFVILLLVIPGFFAILTGLFATMFESMNQILQGMVT